MGMQIDRNRSRHFGLSTGRKLEQEEVRIQVAAGRGQVPESQPPTDRLQSALGESHCCQVICLIYWEQMQIVFSWHCTAQ
jgi:hypothetical protein